MVCFGSSFSCAVRFQAVVLVGVLGCQWFACRVELPTFSSVIHLVGQPFNCRSHLARIPFECKIRSVNFQSARYFVLDFASCAPGASSFSQGCQSSSGMQFLRKAFCARRASVLVGSQATERWMVFAPTCVERKAPDVDILETLMADIEDWVSGKWCSRVMKSVSKRSREVK